MKKILALCFAIAGIFMFSACVNQQTKEASEEEVIIVSEDSIIVSEPDSTMITAPDSLIVEIEEEEVIED